MSRLIISQYQIKNNLHSKFSNEKKKKKMPFKQVFDANSRLTSLFFFFRSRQMM